MALNAAHAVQCQSLLARRESDDNHVALASAFIPVVMAAEADDTAAPHFRFHTRDLLHQFQDGEAVFTLSLVGNAVEELLNIPVIGSGLVFWHFDLLMGR